MKLEKNKIKLIKEKGNYGFTILLNTDNKIIIDVSGYTNARLLNNNLFLVEYYQHYNLLDFEGNLVLKE